MVRISNALCYLALSLWVGAMVFFTFIAAPALFAGLPRDQAARAVGAIFPKYYLIGYVAGTVILVASVLRARRPAYLAGYTVRRAPSRWPVLAAAVMLVLTLYAGLVLLPEAQQLQAQIPTFETDQMTPAREAFQRIHGITWALNLVVLVLGALLLVSRAAVL